MKLKFYISSRIVIALMLSIATTPLHTGIHTVITVLDDTTTPPAGSLRAAIAAANADPDASPIINFAITDGGAQQVKTITLTSNLPPITKDNVTINGSTQTGTGLDNPMVVIDGNGNTYGLQITSASNCEIKNLVINNTSYAPISIEWVTEIPDSNKIIGCFLGIDQTGTTALGSHSWGIILQDATNTIIGEAGEGNLIAGASLGGIAIAGGSNGTNVKGNRIGTNKAGTAALANYDGIFIQGQAIGMDGILNTVIGGPLAGEGNIISGNNGMGITAQSVGNTLIQGNLIGMAMNGLTALGNSGAGIELSNSANCIIGGTATGAKNIISSNGSHGIVGSDADVTIIRGNYIGTNYNGAGSFGNTGDGISLLSDSTNNSIIGNVIGNNTARGIYLANATNSIQDNYIGTDITGEEDLGNGGIGVVLVGATNTVTGNIIGNNAGGLSISSAGNTVRGNSIGTNSAGITNLGNTGNGITLTGSNNAIGGTSLADYNTIAYNDGYGVSVDTGTLNSILGNSIYGNNQSGISLTSNGNGSQAEPRILSATCTDSTVTVIAQAPFAPSASTFRLEFFVNDSDTNPIAEGKKIIGSTTTPAATAAIVTETFTVDFLAENKYLSATATNLNNTGSTPGNTSAFSYNDFIKFASGSSCPSTVVATSSACNYSGDKVTLTAVITGGSSSTYDVLWSDGFIQYGVTSPATRIVTPLTTQTYSAVAVPSLSGTTVVVRKANAEVKAIAAKYY